MANEYPINIGNFLPSDLVMPRLRVVDGGQMVEAPSLAQDWLQQGLTYSLEPPIGGAKFSSEQLAAQGINSVILRRALPDTEPLHTHSPHP